MTRLTDIKAGMRQINAEGIVIAISQPRTVNLKAGGTNTVADATIADDSGQIVLSVWGTDIAKISVGKRVRVTNGYVNVFKNVTSLAIGKFGKLEVL